MTNPDFLAYSDGSGYQDGFGGWAVYVCTPTKSATMFRMGAIIGTTVDRAELTAILEGLQMVMELAASLPRTIPLGQHLWKPKVKLYSDRENLVLSIQGVNERSNSLDLWKRFEFFETHMVIDANFVERETDHEEFTFVDLHASTARIMAKNYWEACGLPQHQPPEVK
jgi:ribonuclease HI